MTKLYPILGGLLFLGLMTECHKPSAPADQNSSANKFSGAAGEVKLMTLDPGHFHAALIQKSMYQQVDSSVYVYAPDGPDLEEHLKRINSFNQRQDQPTHWVQKVYRGNDFLQKMLIEKPGNILMVSGNNAKKSTYLQAAVDAGIHVFADKPMAINEEDFLMLEATFAAAEKRGVLVYDIMTERFEITTIIQRTLALSVEVFGQLEDGTADEPAITKESVHHFYKQVSGSPLKRPAWFYDTRQQGEGIVDVTTHLVDLVQWEAFPEEIIRKNDIQLLSAKRWATQLTQDEFKQSTGLDTFPDYLQQDVHAGKLTVYANGEINYRIKGKHAKVSVRWNYAAPPGSADTHYSIMRGTLSNIIIKQGTEENYQPTVYVEAIAGQDDILFENKLKQAVTDQLHTYPGLVVEKINDHLWVIRVPDKYKVGHEAHFGQVTEKFLQYLQSGKLPAWEVPNMITKYYTTTSALKLAIGK